jgi:hypothetical protein
LFFCSSAECSTLAATASRRRRKRFSVQIKLVTFTLFFCSSAECSSPAATASRGRRQRSGHHWALQSRMCDRSYVQRLRLFEGTSPRVLRCLCAHVYKLVIFALFLCSSSECSSPDAAASRRRRQRSKHRPGNYDQVRATDSERRRGQQPRHHDQVRTCDAQGTAPREAASAPRSSTCLAATTKYLRYAAGIGLGTTIKYRTRCLCVEPELPLCVRRQNPHQQKITFASAVQNNIST